MRLIIDGMRLKPHHHGAVRQVFPEIALTPYRSGEELLEILSGADILAGWVNTIPPVVWSRLGSLRWIHVFSAGVDRVMTPEIIGSDVVITNSRGANGIPISEHVMAMLLSYERSLPVLWRNQVARNWQRVSAQEVCGRSMGIIGFGGIGRPLSIRARSFGLRVLVLKRSGGLAASGPEGHDGVAVDGLYGPEQLYEFLAQLDYLVLAVPLTPETRHIIDVRALSCMKADCLLINIGRGALVDQAALVAALHEGRLRGALLDCFEEEPLPQDSPLWLMSNVMISPHMSGTSDRTADRALEVFLDNLGRLVQGRPMVSVVDRKKGY